MPRAPKEPGTTSTALGPALPSERLRSLERQRTELMRRVNEKKKALERLEKNVSQAEELVEATLIPHQRRFDEVNLEAYSLFEGMLNGGLSKRAHRSVREVFRMLLDEGILSVPGKDDDDVFDDFAPDGSGPFDDESHDEASSRESRRGAPRGRDTDSAPDGAAGTAAKATRESLKPLFRRLALELHPDRVQDDREKEERTKLLKRIVHAYERGDVATLLQAEKAWLAQKDFDTLDEDSHCTALERLIEELHEQLAGLRRSLHRLRNSDALQLVTLPPDSRPGRKTELERIEATIRRELEQLSRLRDFVNAFAEHELTLEQFLIGPELEFAGEVFDFDDLRQRAFEREEPRPQRRRGSKKTRRR